jgi:hypothetical protein
VVSSSAFSPGLLLSTLMWYLVAHARTVDTRQKIQLKCMICSILDASQLKAALPSRQMSVSDGLVASGAAHRQGPGHPHQHHCPQQCAPCCTHLMCPLLKPRMVLCHQLSRQRATTGS